MGLLDSVKKGFTDAVNFSTGKTTLDAIGGGDFMSVVPGIGDAMAAKDQNKANLAAADRAMQFSERMSSTAYQRAAKDMEAAGLNRILSYANPASAPKALHLRSTPRPNQVSEISL